MPVVYFGPTIITTTKSISHLIPVPYHSLQTHKNCLVKLTVINFQSTQLKIYSVWYGSHCVTSHHTFFYLTIIINNSRSHHVIIGIPLLFYAISSVNDICAFIKKHNVKIIKNTKNPITFHSHG